MPASATEPVGSSETLVLPTTRQNGIKSEKAILHHHKNLESEMAQLFKTDKQYCKWKRNFTQLKIALPQGWWHKLNSINSNLIILLK